MADQMRDCNLCMTGKYCAEHQFKRLNKFGENDPAVMRNRDDLRIGNTGGKPKLAPTIDLSKHNIME